MNNPASPSRRVVLALALLAVVRCAPAAKAEERRLLYVAVPGIRNYLEYGGHGLLVFDIDRGHKFVKRIPTAGLDPQGKPDNVKGICASAATGRVYISTIHSLTCLDLASEKILWERTYEGGCDRMAISPDGKTIYQPSFEKDHWLVLDAMTGDVLAKITLPFKGAHNTIYGPDGKHAYLASLNSPLLTIADTTGHVAARQVGPFADSIRPFTIDGRQEHCFVNVNKLLGFEVGDLRTGRKLHRVEVQGVSPGPVKRHGCPSHGIGMTPDGKEIWVVDAHNQMVHVFDATVMPPRQVESLKVRDEPGWVTFSIDGRLAYPSTGDVFDVATHKIIAGLSDEHGGAVMSEKMLEIDFDGDRPVRAGNQFGVGRVPGP
jgi:hypothetical protein